MNHYERLKVTQDAPPEVIRAAYRALANRLHPDRNGGVGGPDDAVHEQMAALNGAYEVLIDPMLRRDYDATLEPIRVTAARPLGEGLVAAAGAEGAAAGAGAMGGREAPLERPWQAQPPLSSRPAWAPSPKHIVAGAVVGVGLMAVVGVALWRMGDDEHPLDRALAVQAVDQSGMAPDGMTPSGQPTAVASGETRRPTVEELSRMSDEELVKALPALDGKPAPRSAASARRPVAVAPQGPHPLDGSPIRLRVETQLVDPLAPATVVKSTPSRGR